MKSLTVSAYAKINTYLDVVSKRTDGYHNIESIMRSVSLCDRITVTCRGDGNDICLSCTDPRLPTNEKNLAYKAARAFADHTGLSGSLSIHIEKNIPFEAGLGGGSSDAAAVLRALNILLGTSLDDAELAVIGARIGADVPFCVFGGCAAVTGIGEIVRPIHNAPEFWAVVAIDGEGVSTPYAFGLLDKKYGDFREYVPEKDFAAVCSAYESSDRNAVCRNVFNLFEEVVLPSHSRASALRSLLTENGADAVLLSGSGPSVVALFDSEMGAENAAELLKRRGIKAWACRTVSQIG